MEPEQTPQEYRDLTIHSLGNELKTAQEFMGPRELATQITVAITDTEYLKELVEQMTNNLNGR